jgi:hypothetical protein
MRITANPSLILFHAAFFWRYLSMMRRYYVRSYGAFGAQSRYRIKPTATPGYARMCGKLAAGVYRLRPSSLCHHDCRALTNPARSLSSSASSRARSA